MKRTERRKRCENHLYHSQYINIRAFVAGFTNSKIGNENVKTHPALRAPLPGGDRAAFGPRRGV